MKKIAPIAEMLVTAITTIIAVEVLESMLKKLLLACKGVWTSSYPSYGSESLL